MPTTARFRQVLLVSVLVGQSACGGTENAAPATTIQVNAADTLELVAERLGTPVAVTVLLTPQQGALPPALTATPVFASGATAGWLSGTITVTDSGSALLRVSANPGSLGPGVFPGSLRVTSPTADINAADVPVRLSIGTAPLDFRGQYTGSYSRVTTGGCTAEALTRPVVFAIEQSADDLIIRLGLQDPDFIPLTGLRADAVASGGSFSGGIPGPSPASGSISGKLAGSRLTGTVQLSAPGAGCNGSTKYHAITYTAQRSTALAGTSR